MTQDSPIAPSSLAANPVSAKPVQVNPVPKDSSVNNTNNSVNNPNNNISNTPLVNTGPDHILYIGLFLLIVTIVNVAGLISKKVKSALIFSLILTGILIALLWFL